MLLKGLILFVLLCFGCRAPQPRAFGLTDVIKYYPSQDTLFLRLQQGGLERARTGLWTGKVEGVQIEYVLPFIDTAGLERLTVFYWDRDTNVSIQYMKRFTSVLQARLGDADSTRGWTNDGTTVLQQYWHVTTDSILSAINLSRSGRSVFLRVNHKKIQ